MPPNNRNMPAGGAGGAQGGARQQNPPFITIAVKPDTYSKLVEIKTRYGFRSFDDVVKLLLSGCRP